MGVTLGPSRPDTSEVNWTTLGPEAMVAGMVVVRFRVVWSTGGDLRGLWARERWVVWRRRNAKRKFGRRNAMLVLFVLWVRVCAEG